MGFFGKRDDDNEPVQGTPKATRCRWCNQPRGYLTKQGTDWYWCLTCDGHIFQPRSNPGSSP